MITKSFSIRAFAIIASLTMILSCSNPTSANGGGTDTGGTGGGTGGGGGAVTGGGSASPSGWWGPYERMDNGDVWYIGADKVSIQGGEYTISSATDSSIVLSGRTLTRVSGGSGLTKVAEGSMTYYLYPKERRQGSFSGNIVGSAGARALGGTDSLANIKAIVQNLRNPADTREVTTDADGKFTVSDAIPGDVYVVKPQVAGGASGVDVKPLDSGTDVGQVAVVDTAYNFKAQTDYKGAFFFADGTTQWPLTIDIVNNGSQESPSPIWEAAASSTGIAIVGTAKNNLQTISPGDRRSFGLVLTCDPIAGDYEDKTISIKISIYQGPTWEDRVTVRFWKDERLTINLNSQYSVRASVLTPEGRSIGFSQSISIPRKAAGLKVALSGASNATETKYAIGVGVSQAIDWGSTFLDPGIDEPNDLPAQAVSLYIDDPSGKMRMGYLRPNEMDFFRIVEAPFTSPSVAAVSLNLPGIEDASSYSVSRGTAVEGPFSPVATVPAPGGGAASVWTDSSAPAGKLLFYKIDTARTLGGDVAGEPFAAYRPGRVVSGRQEASAAWTRTDGLVVVRGRTIIPPGVTVSIEPSVTVLFDDGATLETAGGYIVADGTSAEPIAFTSLTSGGGLVFNSPTEYTASLVLDEAWRRTQGNLLRYCSFSNLAKAIQIKYAGAYVDRSVFEASNGFSVYGGDQSSALSFFVGNRFAAPIYVGQYYMSRNYFLNNLFDKLGAGQGNWNGTHSFNINYAGMPLFYGNTVDSPKNGLIFGTFRDLGSCSRNNRFIAVPSVTYDYYFANAHSFEFNSFEKVPSSFKFTLTARTTVDARNLAARWNDWGPTIDAEIDSKGAGANIKAFADYMDDPQYATIDYHPSLSAAGREGLGYSETGFVYYEIASSWDQARSIATLTPSQKLPESPLASFRWSKSADGLQGAAWSNLPGASIEIPVSAAELASGALTVFTQARDGRGIASGIVPATIASSGGTAP